MTASKPPVIQIRRLTKSYGQGDATVHALRGPRGRAASRSASAWTSRRATTSR
ncbi:hypothetical protein [Kitasatospora paranensis]|uniref:hypothetical protein n=1 Tax=Kitasatospora paranensis TaxID=258053 RepID=UPI0031EB4EB6